MQVQKMNLKYAPGPKTAVTVTQEQSGVRLTWKGMPPTIWMSTDRGRAGDVVIPLMRAIRAMKVSLDQGTMLLIYR